MSLILIMLAIAGIIATIFLKLVAAGVSGALGLLAFCSYLGNMEWAIGVSKHKIRLLQGAILILGLALEPIVLYPYWREERAALTEGDLLGGTNRSMMER